jgi:hypothetical protein
MGFKDGSWWEDWSAESAISKGRYGTVGQDGCHSDHGAQGVGVLGGFRKKKTPIPKETRHHALASGGACEWHGEDGPRNQERSD